MLASKTDKQWLQEKNFYFSDMKLIFSQSIQIVAVPISAVTKTIQVLNNLLSSFSFLKLVI